jgi:hypothetical protein
MLSVQSNNKVDPVVLMWIRKGIASTGLVGQLTNRLPRVP